MYEKNFDSKLTKSYGFTTKCCSRNVLLSKSAISYCPHCNSQIKIKEVMLSKKCFFTYDLTQLIESSLNQIDLKEESLSESSINSVFDGEFYKKARLAKHPDDLLLPATFSCDGVPYQGAQVYPTFLDLALKTHF